MSAKERDMLVMRRDQALS
jgi:hypothetical protein